MTWLDMTGISDDTMIRLVVELIWPLALFLILMWVRSKGLKQHIHQCHFDEKAMPSVGLFPFIQKTLCTFNNTCYPTLLREEDHEAAGDFIGFDSSLILEFVADLERIIKPHKSARNMEIRKRLSKDLELLSRFVKKFTDPEYPIDSRIAIKDLVNEESLATKYPYPQLPLTHSAVQELLFSTISIRHLQKVFDRGNQTLRQYLCDSGGLEEMIQPGDQTLLISEVCALNPNNLTRLSHILIKETDLDALGRHLSNLTYQVTGSHLQLDTWRRMASASSSVLQQLYRLESPRKLLSGLRSSYQAVQELGDMENATARLLQLSACGRNISTLFDPESQGPIRHIEELKEQIKNNREKLMQKDSYLYEYDNRTTQKCNSLFKTLEENENTRMIWKQLKPLVRGKILYTPEGPATQQLIRTVNDSFTPIRSILNFTQSWLDNLHPIFHGFLKNSTLTLQLIKSIVAPSNVPLIGLMDSSLRGPPNETLASMVADLHFLLEQMLEHWEDWLSEINKMVMELHDYLQCLELDRFEALPNEDALVKRGLSLMTEDKFWAGLVFDIRPDAPTLPPYLRYKIRMDANKVDTTKKIENTIPRPGPRRRPAIDLKYISHGFAYIQDMVEKALIREHTGVKEPTGVFLQQMPYPCYIMDQFIMAVSRSFPLFMVLSWIYSCSMIIKSVVHEKEQRLKEMMKAMGLTNAVLWVSWFLQSFLVMSLSAFLLTLVLVYGKVVENSDPLVVYVLLLCYAVSTIAKGFFISTLFSRANVAAAAGGLIFFLTYLPYPFLVMWEEKLSFLEKVSTSLLSNVAFGYGCNYLAQFEQEGVGVHWSNVASSTLPRDTFSLAHVMVLLLLDGVLYGFFTWYIEAVFPGQYGVPKPWYFFATHSYWCGTVSSKNCTRAPSIVPNAIPPDSLTGGGRDKEVALEEEPEDLPLGVSIKHLTKVYDKDKVAVNDLSLNFYEGQITSFLGHNGAGKTTTISILTGMFPPTSGTATIYGADIQMDMDIIRHSLGTCPQHNVLFDYLTVMEHLWFYASLKGLPKNEVLREAQEIIEDIGLANKKNELSKNLSGGMQRKLSIAIAFVGGSRTVILDEPTAGVDPYARRSIWELLIKYKTGQ
ncbi:ABCA1 [Cordylochernes scorpioides]|uniref:ABCA1 n=1 Tax=Cordylochernes scorpioides TaxID=51811 RepID=A0ABY6KET6_9ARAC|nr:ABCA1 [Cordylochernes scorpioides]